MFTVQNLFRAIAPCMAVAFSVLMILARSPSAKQVVAADNTWSVIQLILQSTTSWTSPDYKNAINNIMPLPAISGNGYINAISCHTAMGKTYLLSTTFFRMKYK